MTALNLRGSKGMLARFSFAMKSSFDTRIIGMKSLLLFFLFLLGLTHSSTAGVFPPVQNPNYLIPSIEWLNRKNPVHLGENTAMVDPNITVRFANPQFNCNNSELCFDIQFQSDIAGHELFGMNVRFFYDDSWLELINFRGYVGGYGPAAPNPPAKATSASAGPALFNFTGPAEFINGAIILANENLTPVIISTSGWTKVFQICFSISQPNPNINSFCPSLVWDLEQNPANGGFLAGDDGVVMTVVNTSGGTLPVFEQVNQYNWEYIGNGSPPYGMPNMNNCSSISCLPIITCPANVSISCGASTLPSNTGSASAIDFCAGDPVISYSDAFNGGPCPAPWLITRTWLATDNCSNSSTCSQQIAVGGSACILTVNTTADSGTGSLRAAIECAMPGDTIKFSSSLAGQTINISTAKLLLNKHLFIRSTLSPRVKITSQIPGLFEVASGINIEFKDIDITSGTTISGNVGAAFHNNGTLKLIGIKVLRNPSLPSGEYLIRNKPSSNLTLIGSCFIQYN